MTEHGEYVKEMRAKEAADVVSLAQYRRVAVWYIAANRLSEPLGFDGKCHFCRAYRAGGPKMEHHTPECAWYAVAKNQLNWGEAESVG
jgi:hypothetical protein